MYFISDWLNITPTFIVGNVILVMVKNVIILLIISGSEIFEQRSKTFFLWY